MRTSLRGAFTLVELLVVIAIISVLAAMLLPSLQESMKMARRISCLNDRKQNYLWVQSFANEHHDRLPSEIRNWNTGNRRLDNFLIDLYPSVNGVQGTFVSGIHDSSAVLGGATAVGSASPLGILAAFGYAQSPQLFFCPDFQRTQSLKAACIDNNAAQWEQLCDSSTPMPGGTLGIVHYFYLAMGNYQSMAICGPNLSTLSNIARYHRTAKASPMILSCANRRTGAVPFPQLRSHSLEGISGTFFDGSARWIDIEEIDPLGTRRLAVNRDDMSNCSGLYASLQFWARASLTLGRP